MIDFKKVKRLTDEAARRSGRFRYLKKNATTMLRILEYPDKDGDLVFAQPLVEHRRQGAGGKSLGICRQEIFGKPCAYCRVNQVERDAGRDAPFISRTRYVVNAIDIENEPDNLRMWVLPVTVFNSVAEYAVDDDWRDVLEPKTGFAFAVKRSGEQLDTEYVTKTTRKPYPVKKTIAAQVKNPIDYIPDESVESQCAAIGIDMSEIWEEVELSKMDIEDKSGSGKSGGKGKAAKEPSIPHASVEPPTIDVGSPVHYLAEKQVCHVVTIDGEDVTIEDGDGEKWDVSLSELSLAEDEGSDDGDDGDDLWDEGGRCVVEIDGEDYAGTIKAIKGDEAIIEFDDGDKQTHPLEDLKKESDEPEPETGGFEPGDRVIVNIDGDDYAGEIEAITAGGKAAIAFDDGDKDTYDVSELMAEEEVESADPNEPDTTPSGEKPPCFGDSELYSAKDKECQECGSFQDCGGNVELDMAGVGKSKQQLAMEKKARSEAKTAKKSSKKASKKAVSRPAPRDTASIVAGILD